MPEIEWVECPPGILDTDKYAEFARELRQHPGKWAVLRDQNRSTAGNIRLGTIRAFQPPRSFQAKSHRDKAADRIDIYVRFTGSND